MIHRILMADIKSNRRSYHVNITLMCLLPPGKVMVVVKGCHRYQRKKTDKSSNVNFCHCQWTKMCYVNYKGHGVVIILLYNDIYVSVPTTT